MALVIAPNVYQWGFVPLFPAEVRHEENLAQSKKSLYLFSQKYTTY